MDCQPLRGDPLPESARAGRGATRNGAAPEPAVALLRAAPCAPRSRNLDADSLEFTDDAPVAPMRVLTGEPENDRAQ